MTVGATADDTAVDVDARRVRIALQVHEENIGVSIDATVPIAKQIQALGGHRREATRGDRQGGCRVGDPATAARRADGGLCAGSTAHHCGLGAPWPSRASSTG